MISQGINITDWRFQMKKIVTLCALASLIGGYTITALPVWADAASDAAKAAAKAAAEQNQANQDVAKGHPFRAGRAAKRAQRDQERAARDAAKAQQGK
jgi:hypothetical protein